MGYIAFLSCQNLSKMKISESDFFAILRECAGIYARAARVISKKIGEPYSRQAVRERAEKRPDLMSDIEEENKDIAEEGLQSLMRSKDESIRMKSVFLYLKTKCRDRGYGDQPTPPPPPTIIINPVLPKEDDDK